MTTAAGQMLANPAVSRLVTGEPSARANARRPRGRDGRVRVLRARGDPSASPRCASTTRPRGRSRAAPAPGPRPSPAVLRRHFQALAADFRLRAGEPRVRLAGDRADQRRVRRAAAHRGPAARARALRRERGRGPGIEARRRRRPGRARLARGLRRRQGDGERPLAPTAGRGAAPTRRPARPPAAPAGGHSAARTARSSPRSRWASAARGRDLAVVASDDLARPEPAQQLGARACSRCSRWRSRCSSARSPRSWRPTAG